MVLPLTCMTSAGKIRADRAIETIRERGHTNLSAGLLAALQVFNVVNFSLNIIS